MSGTLCVLWLDFVSVVMAYLIGYRPSPVTFPVVEEIFSSWLFFPDHSLLNFESPAASPDGAHASLFLLAVRWELPPSPILAGRVHAPHISFPNSGSSTRPAFATKAVAESF